MKVNVSFTLDVDADAWAATYGMTDRAAIRADVKAHVESTVVTHFESLDLLTER